SIQTSTPFFFACALGKDRIAKTTIDYLVCDVGYIVFNCGRCRSGHRITSAVLAWVAIVI
ncbi:hypothetical protein, partial [Ferrimicrobium acidiphilum]|uniref:hypothetical protein n=1 Tax=Ferrimicrobium acidiphilum TaxID=121039 RepID=UPI0023EF8A44